MEYIKNYSLFESELNSNPEWVSIFPDEKMGYPSLEKLEKLPWFKKIKESFPNLKDVSTPKIIQNGNLYLDLGEGTVYKIYKAGYISRVGDSRTTVDLNKKMETLSDWNELFSEWYLKIRKNERYYNGDFSSRKIKKELGLLYSQKSLNLVNLSPEEIKSIPQIYFEKLKENLIDLFKSNPEKAIFKTKDSPILVQIYKDEIKGKMDLPSDTAEDIDLVIDLADVGL
jgi:hypothetical protein